VLRSIKELRGYDILATDGKIGQVHDFYFDDRYWTVRYLVVETGNWLAERRVLLSPLALQQPDWLAHVMPVMLTKQQIESSPPIYRDKPVSRQMEADLHRYYRWVPYWQSLPTAGPGAAAVVHMMREKNRTSECEDPHLRSTQEVIGYRIQARDGEIGHVDDFIVNDQTWLLTYVVIDTGNWLSGKKVLIAPTWAEQVSWVKRKVKINLDREAVRNSPEFDPSVPVNREYEVQLYDYYGRPRNWA
jgi:uncharacterized protein YrrD